MASNQDVEINLGTGKLLGLFFALVVLCAVFFALGYSVGKNSMPQVVSAAAAEPATSAAPKPHAGGAAPAAQNAPSSSDELTFYKAVEQKDPNPKLAPPPAPAPPPKAPEMSHPGSYMVQVAAVTKQEDAQALVGALKKKNYPVFINNAAGNDRLYHVQIGPFNDMKEAESMRERLAGDGYNPIVKK